MSATSPYDTPDYHALVRHMRTDGSDLARLVIADWLEERGEGELAAFIRTGVEAERIRRGLKQPHQSSRWRDACDALGQSATASAVSGWVPACPWSWHHSSWVSGSRPATADAERVVIWWRRGFADVVRMCPLAWWMEHGPALVRQHPVDRVTLTDREPRPNSADDESVDWWGWYVVGELAERERYDLPLDLWPHMREAAGSYFAGGHESSRWCQYPTREAALDALSAALIAHAKGVPS